MIKYGPGFNDISAPDGTKSNAGLWRLAMVDNKWRIISYKYPTQYLVLIIGQSLRTSDGSDGELGQFTADEAPKGEGFILISLRMINLNVM